MDPFCVNVASPHLLRKHCAATSEGEIATKNETANVHEKRPALPMVTGFQSSVSSWTGTRPWASAHQLIGTLGIGNVAVMTREFPSVFVLAPNSQR